MVLPNINKVLIRNSKRKLRIRNKLILTSTRRFRLLVNRSNRHFSCQIVDSNNGDIILSASSKEKDLCKQNASNCNKTIANKVGDIIGKKAKEKGIDKIVFDRSGYKYHGIVKSFADSVRKYIDF